MFGGLRAQEHDRLRHTCHAAWRGTATVEVKEVKVDLCFRMWLVWPSELPVLQAYEGAAWHPHSSPLHHSGTGPAISTLHGRTVCVCNLLPLQVNAPCTCAMIRSHDNVR